MRTTGENAELALLLEVAGTPKPGNVDRHREYDDLRFEHFLAGAVGSQRGLRAAAKADGPPVGEAFERAVAGMSEQSGGNTQFGALLLVVPLARAAGRGTLAPEGVSAVVDSTTVTDAAGFYRAFEHVDVSVDDPPEDMDALDVRRGSDAVPELHARDLTLEAIMERSAAHDGVAREWVGGFERSFWTADRLSDLDGPVADRASRVFLEALAEEPDTFVAINHDETTAERVSERAAAVLEGDEDAETMADDLVERGVNPGTTADIVAAGLFIALERGLDV
ncbi:triphosphoribosyl-dephospho-CoA synthase [Halapricum salinum]|uniref:Triphosphoribosyl-dephospho-CoA synthase n=1 Tax=Halapricum salinum TaxID=1457250 RepID=A0A4D6HF09_9EURY|nr:triphosphoribosyl-dephospho-CoA synthase [Halapricum salinum]QCC51876.1 triphosphoribosyl-dephospho-CoA synthase [Halapricum salinum]